jgi:hypothetical protein
MPEFIFEVVREEEPPILAGVLSLPDHKAAWCHVESLAFRNKHNFGACIRVIDSDGDMVIRCGVVTALASIKRCQRGPCLLKQKLDA